MRKLLPSKPENYWGIIKRSLRLYRVSIAQVFSLSLLLSILAFLPRFISIFMGHDVFLNFTLFDPQRLWIILLNIVCMLVFIAMLWRIHCIIVGIHEPFLQDFRIGLKKVLYVFIANIIASFIIVTITMTLYGLEFLLVQYHLLFAVNTTSALITLIVFSGQLILTVYLLTLFVFLLPLIAIENEHIFTSIKRSVLLVWNHWWRTFSVQITPWLSYLILLVIIKFLLNVQIHIYFTRLDVQNIWPSILHVLLFAFFIPWVGAILLVQLNDLELRNEHALKKRKRK